MSTYRRLVEKRKACRLCCPPLINPSTVQGGALDCEQIGPYSKWQSDLNTDILIVGKDFYPDKAFVKYSGSPNPDAPTNRRLQQYLEMIGYPIGTPNAPRRQSRVFLTNAVLCLPCGDEKRTKNIPKSAFQTCGRHFLKPLIELLCPQFVVSLGDKSTWAVIESLELSTNLNFRELTRKKDGLLLPIPTGGRLFPVFHPVASVPREEHEKSWLRIKNARR